jgi:hypothetical protein
MRAGLPQIVPVPNPAERLLQEISILRAAIQVIERRNRARDHFACALAV